MPIGIIRPDGSIDWYALENAARETCRDLNMDRALNMCRVLPKVAARGRELEAEIARRSSE